MVALLYFILYPLYLYYFGQQISEFLMEIGKNNFIILIKGN
jgi:hypothetical protein